MNKIDKLANLLLIIIILYVAYLAYIHGFIFEGDHWHQQTRCDGNCSRLLHPSYLHLVLFSGTCMALGITILSDSISYKSPVSKFKYHIKQQIDEIKAMGPVQYQLCFNSSFLLLSTFLLGLMIVRYVVWSNCVQHVMGFGEQYPLSACNTYWFQFTYVFYRVLAFIILWYFPKIISWTFRIPTTTVTHSDGGNK
tara:strand:- start:464 stop:1048 length:585 start_codon:yes stop_codon:yes gene_type:complete